MWIPGQPGLDKETWTQEIKAQRSPVWAWRGCVDGSAFLSEDAKVPFAAPTGVTPAPGELMLPSGLLEHTHTHKYKNTCL